MGAIAEDFLSHPLIKTSFVARGFARIILHILPAVVAKIVQHLFDSITYSTSAEGIGPSTMEPTVEIYKPAQILSTSTGAGLSTFVEQGLAAGSKLFLVDMSEALFMDSTGLGYLISVLQKIQAARGKLFLCSLKGQASMLLELTKTEGKFQIFLDQQQFNEWLATQSF